MQIPGDELARIYEARDSEAALVEKVYTNLALAKIDDRDFSYSISSDCLMVAASVLLRPISAMKYSLLPALDFLFSSFRPYAGALNMASAHDLLARRVALLLQTHDPKWQELPYSWTVLGNDLDCGNFIEANETLNEIFKSAKIKEPLKFLREFAEPPKHSREWQRHFHLDIDELAAFKNEKQATLAKLNMQDNEG